VAAAETVQPATQDAVAGKPESKAADNRAAAPQPSFARLLMRGTSRVLRFSTVMAVSLVLLFSMSVIATAQFNHISFGAALDILIDSTGLHF
jgi:hypothetical protein